MSPYPPSGGDDVSSSNATVHNHRQFSRLPPRRLASIVENKSAKEPYGFDDGVAASLHTIISSGDNGTLASLASRADAAKGGDGDDGTSEISVPDEEDEDAKTMCNLHQRQIRFLASSIAIIAAASILIGMILKGPASGPTQGDKSQSNLQMSVANPQPQQQLLIAKEIVSACGQTQLDRDKSRCQSLCRERLCCFETKEKYNCHDDGGKDCAVYAACKVLIEGAPITASETVPASVKRHVMWG